MTPVEFYAARLDELEAVGRPLAAPYMFFEDLAALSLGEIDYVKTLNPAYVLADIAAKRAIIDSYHAAAARCDAEPEWGDGLCDLAFYALKGVVTTLCLAFANHPDFDESWKL